MAAVLPGTSDNSTAPPNNNSPRRHLRTASHIANDMLSINMLSFIGPLGQKHRLLAAPGEGGRVA